MPKKLPEWQATHNSNVNRIGNLNYTHNKNKSEKSDNPGLIPHIIKISSISVPVPRPSSPAGATTLPPSTALLSCPAACLYWTGATTGLWRVRHLSWSPVLYCPVHRCVSAQAYRLSSRAAGGGVWRQTVSSWAVPLPSSGQSFLGKIYQNNLRLL